MSFTNHLTMEEQGDEFYKQFILKLLMDAQNENENGDSLEDMTFEIDEFTLTFEVDQERELITDMITNEEATIQLEGTSLDIERETEYIFDQYDEEIAIDIPEDAFEITTIDTYINEQ